MKAKYRSNLAFTRDLNAYRKKLKLTVADLCVILEIADRTAFCWLHGRAPHPLTQEGALARLRAEKENQIKLTGKELASLLKSHSS